MNNIIKLLVTFSFSLALTGCLIPTKELIVYENSIGMKQGAQGVYDIEVPINENKTLKGSVALCGDNNDYNMVGYAQDYKIVYTFKGDYVPSKVSGQDDLYILAFRDLEVVKHDIGEEIKSDSKIKYSLAFYKHDGNKLTVWSRDAISEDDAKKSPEEIKSIIERTVNSKLSSTRPLMRSTNQKPCSTLLGNNYKELKEIIAAKKSKKNYKTKEELLKSACDRDDVAKCAELASHYINRKNNKDEKLSLKYYDHSCKNGYVEACFHLAKEYRLGDCDGLFCSKNSLITKDLKKSDKYFDLICNPKHKKQCSNIVTFLLENSSRIGSYKFDDSSEESIVKYYMVSNESLTDDLLMKLNVTILEEKNEVTTILTGKYKKNYSGVLAYWFKNGKIKQKTHYVDGKKHGLHTKWHENGNKRSEVSYTNGVIQGISLWKENGSLKAIFGYRNGERISLTSYYENGKKEEFEEYRNDERISRTSYYKNGKKKEFEEYRNDKPNGLLTRWDSSGKKYYEAHYVNGKLNGIETYWHENGQKKSEQYYENDIKNGLYTKWSERGDLTFKTSYVNGKEDVNKRFELMGAELGKKLIESLFSPSNSTDNSYSSSSNYSSSNSSSVCNSWSDEPCFQIVRRKSSGAVIVKCIKGSSFNIGQEKCLSYNKNTGKYADSCSISSSFAHHYKLVKAGNLSCE